MTSKSTAETIAETPSTPDAGASASGAECRDEETVARSRRMMSRDSVVNRSRLRRYVLDVASQRRHRFTRVGAEFYQMADAHMKAWVRDHVQQLPSKGRTIK